MFGTYLTKIKVKVAEFTRKHSSGLSEAIFIAIIAVICFIPTYIGIFIWCVVSPVGFWQLLATIALLLIVFGSTQGVAIFFAIIIIISTLVKPY